ncbi:hypothetical protein DQQ10_05935 [Pseudochryseolinea flava]|uniref:Uncharacterized protein n=1 Tax=Pseudochryseolinea flava TaxID=2059302 RepID=A0A364Y8A6_9BACT|nr:hypothetical protein DQQ10_05935 [Pseudochryseolinea flava]
MKTLKRWKQIQKFQCLLKAKFRLRKYRRLRLRHVVLPRIMPRFVAHQVKKLKIMMVPVVLSLKMAHLAVISSNKGVAI